MKIAQSVWASFFALSCTIAVGALQQPQLQSLQHKAQNLSPANLNQEVAAEKLRLQLLKKTPAFGFDNLLANWVFLNFLQYFGDDEVRAITGYQLSPEYFEVVINRDPRFKDAYYFLSTSCSIYAGMPDRGVKLINLGLKSLSPQVPDKSYYILRQKGVDELLFLGDHQAAKQSFDKAAEWASIYQDEESQYVAELSRQTAKFLARNPNSKFAQVGAWTSVLTTARDKRSRQIAINRIESLGGKVLISPDGKVQVKMPPKD
jgi:hypothetical protein